MNRVLIVAEWVIVISLVLIALALSSHAQPVYCQPDVIKAMGQIWAASSNGSTGIEATFILNGTPDAYKIEMEHPSNEYGKQHIYTRPSTFAVIHVHPNMSGEYPSTPANAYSGSLGDTGMADALKLDIYVVSNRGLTVYYYKTKVTAKLRDGVDWYKAKNCR